jgi:ubiquinone/menaquinone biosynthesis C-methylase UbiE
MLTVARRLRPDIEWRQGDAGRLPFPDSSFDVVLCQAGVMFFPDVEQALREMARVVTNEGTVAYMCGAVWSHRPVLPSSQQHFPSQGQKPFPTLSQSLRCVRRKLRYVGESQARKLLFLRVE